MASDPMHLLRYSSLLFTKKNRPAPRISITQPSCRWLFADSISTTKYYLDEFAMELLKQKSLPDINTWPRDYATSIETHLKNGQEVINNRKLSTPATKRPTVKSPQQLQQKNKNMIKPKTNPTAPTEKTAENILRQRQQHTNPFKNNDASTTKKAQNSNIHKRTWNIKQEFILIHILLYLQSSQNQQNTNHQTGYCSDILQHPVYLNQKKNLLKHKL